jgi:hypothetical protein
LPRCRFKVSVNVATVRADLTMAEITSLAVTATVEIVKVLPDVGPGGGGPGGGSKMISEPSEIENVYSNAILEFRKKYG